MTARNPHSAVLPMAEGNHIVRSLVIASGILATLIGGVTLMGWLSGSLWLTDMFNSGVIMKGNAALAMTCGGLAVLLLGMPRRNQSHVYLSRIAAAVMLALGALTLSEHVLGWNLGIDQAIFKDDHNLTATASPGRMGPPASTCYTLLGAALLVLSGRRHSKSMVPQIMAMVALLIATLGMIGNLYRFEPLYAVARWTGISIQTCLGLVGLAIGVLCMQPSSALMKVIFSRDAGSMAVRRLAPAAILLPVLLGWISVTGERAGWFDIGFALAVLILALVGSLLSLIWWTGNVLNRVTTGKQHLAALVESSDDAILSKTLEGNVLSWNPGAQRLFGYSAEEIVGRSVTTLFPPDRMAEEELILSRIRRGERLDHFETVRRTKHGRLIDVSLTISPVRDASGQIIAASKIARDITDQRRTQKSLNDFFDNAVVGLHWVGSDGRILRANRAELEMLGYKPDEYIGHYIAEFHIDQNGINALLARLKRGESVRDHRARLRCKDGSIKHVLIDSNVLWENGEFIHTRSFTRDITIQVEAEERQRRQNQQLQALYRMSDAVNRAASISEICELAMDSLIQVANADRASILLFDEDGVMRFKCWRGLSDAYRAAVEGHSPWKPEDALAQPITVPDVIKDESLRPYLPVFQAEKLRALGFIPLIDRGRVLGKFMTYFDQPHVFTDDEMAICRAIASTVAFSINRQRAHQALEDSEKQLAVELRDMTRLHQLSTELQREDEMFGLLRDVVKSCIELLGGDKGNVQIVDEADHSLKIVAQIGFDDAFMQDFGTVPCGYSVCGEAMRAGERLLVEDARLDPRFKDLAPVYQKHGFVSVQSTPLRSADGSLLGMLSTHFAEPHRLNDRDLRLLDLYAHHAERIIEQARAKAALSASEERYRRLVSLMPAGVYTCEAPTGRITFFNKRAAELWGHEPKLNNTEHCFCGSLRLFKPDGTPMPHAETPMATALQSGVPCRNQDVVIERSDGSRIWAVVNIDPIFDELGELVGAINVFVDNTAARRAQEELRESEERFRLAVDAAHIITWDMDPATGYTICSPNTAEIWGFHEGPGEVFFNAMHEDDREQAIRDSKRAIAGEMPVYSSEYRVKTPQGDYRWIHSRGEVKRDTAGKAARFVGVSVDITERKNAELALLESRQRLELALRAGKVGVWDWDIVSDKVSWTETLYRIHGLERHQFTNTVHGFASLVYPDDAAKVEQALQRTLEHGDPYEVEFRTLRPDGTLAWLFTNATVVRDDQGKPVRMIGATVDLTQQKKIEQALRQSERLYRGVGESINYGIWVCEPDGRNLYASQSFLDLVGMTQEQCSNFGWGDVLHPDDARETMESWKKCAEGGDFWEREHRFRGVDGEWHYVLARGVPIKDDDGKLLCWAGINLDIAALKHAERTIRKSEERFRGAFEQAPFPMQTFAPDGTIRMANRAWSQLWQTTFDDLQGYNILQDAQIRELGAMSLVERAFAGESIAIGPLEYDPSKIDREGRVRWVEAALYPLKDQNGQIFEVVLTLHDVTEQMLAQKELEKHREKLEELVSVRTAELERTHQALRLSERMAAIGTLSAGLGHDMGNLLLPVRARLDALSKNNLPGESQEHVESIRSCLEYLQKLSQGLRQFALDTDSGDAREVTEVVEWKSQIESFYRNAMARTTQLQWHIPEMPLHARVARHALTQAVYNLVQNAGEVLRGRNDGLVRIVIDALDEKWVRISVSDNGPGMTDEVKARCLEPFFTTKTRGLSTGLGLSLVHGVVNRVGGELRIHTKVDEGTTFELRLPLAKPVSTNPNRPQALVEITNRRVQSFLTQALSSLGYELISDADAVRPPAVLVVEVGSDCGGILKARQFIAAGDGRKALIIGGNGAATEDGRLRTIESDAKPSQIIQQLRAMTAS